MAPAKGLLGTSMGIEHIISQIKIQAMISATPKDAGKHYLIMQQNGEKVDELTVLPLTETQSYRMI